MKAMKFKRAALILTLFVMTFSAVTSGTIAWFTDSATSAGNVISSGNLDVELYHSNSVDNNEKVEKTVSLFDTLSTGLWEPGAVVYENFTVKNAGSLALKYQLSLKVDQETIVGDHKLSEAVQYAIIPGGIQVSGREEAIALGNNAVGGWRALANQPLTQITGELEASAADVDEWGIILYWLPTAQDNLFNMNNDNSGLALNMQVAVKLVATQYTSESDAFGSTYDAEADFTQSLVVTADADGSFEVVSEENNLMVSGEAAAPGAPITVTVEDTLEAADEPSEKVISAMLDGQTLASYDIHVEGQKTGSLVTVALQLQTGLSDVVVFHENTRMGAAGSSPAANTFVYNAATGVLTLYVDDFSAFHFIYTQPGHNTNFKPSKEIQGYIKAVTDDVDLRDSAGPSNKPSASIPTGTVIPYYGAVRDNEDNVWFYVQFELNGKKYKGFVKGDDQIVLTDKHGDSLTPSTTPAPTAPSAPTPTPYIPFTWKNKGTYIIITGYTGTDPDVVVPNTIENLPVTAIGGGAFWERSDLTSIIIPEGVTSIGGSAFNYCTNLTSITMPDSLTSIGPGAFVECSSLTSVTIPNKVTDISEQAFLMCSGLTDVTISNGVKTIGNEAFFGCGNLTSITIPASIVSIGEKAFKSCDELKDIQIDANSPAFCFEDGVIFSKDKKTINCCFEWKSGAYTIPDGVTKIDKSAFSSCHRLTSITIPNSVTNIEEQAFYNCNGLTSIVIPEGVKSINHGAFMYCDFLESITLPSSITEIGDEAFFGTPIHDIQIDADNPAYCLKDGILFSKDMKNVVFCPSRKSGAYTIPDTVTSINNYAFSYSHLTSIIIPSSVKSIGNFAFEFGEMSSITIAEGVKNIGDFAFSSCDNLTSIKIPASVTNIGFEAFLWCDRLTNITVTEGSNAEQYCKDNNLPYTYTD